MGLGNPPATPNTWADPITLNGQIDATTGAISGATLSMPPITQPPTDGETPTFTFTEVHPGTATGSYNATTGAVTLDDQLSLSFHIDPLEDTCISRPIDVALSGTYDSTTQDVTLATTSSFTIPQFQTSANCIAPVAAGINASPGGVAGSVGNSMTLALNGQFTPGLPTTTTLAAVTPPTPQPVGTSVTMTASVADPSGAGTPAGNVNFLNNGALLGTEALTPSGTTGTATATYSTSTLPGGTNQLSATYTGSTSYAPSSSTAQSYVIQAAPTISANLPQQMTVGAAAQPFTMTVSNPSSGQSYPTAYLRLFVPTATTGNRIIEPSPSERPIFSYQDSGGNWCTMPYTTSSTKGGLMYYSGAGTPPCGTPLSSFSLAPGATESIPMEVSFPAGGNSGTEPFEVNLFSGSCTSATSCSGTSEGELLNTSITVLPSAGPSTVGATVTDGFTGRPATTTVQQGFDVGLVADVTGATGNYAYPTGTTQFFVDGQSALTEPVSATGNTCPAAGGCESSTPTVGNAVVPPYYSTANLAPGTHTVLMNYSGDQIFAPASLTEAFTVVAGPPAGTLFTCVESGGFTVTPVPFSAYVTATAGIPATAPAGTTVNASAISVTLNLDGASIRATAGGFGTVPTAAIGFSPSGSVTTGSTTFTGTETSLTTTGTWSGLSTSVPITGAPGTQVPIGVNSISFVFNTTLGKTADCTPNAGSAPLGTVTVSGNTLSASPSDSAPAGAPVTLTDTVYPTPPSGTTAGTWGQVDFYDGTTDLGTVPVVTTSSGPLVAGNGTATFATAALSTGDHQLTAIWSGNANVPPNTSSTVPYTMGTATTTSLASSANPANAANPVTFRATVSPPDGATAMPTGDVSFTSDGNPISGCANRPLSMASPPTATCTTSFGAGQSHAIVATYGGDATYLGSASDPLTQKTLAGTNTSILSTKDPSPPGNVTFWSGVSPSSGTGATPTGTVAFSIDGATYKPCASQPIGSGGGASCTVSFKAGTTHKVFATYAGSASYSGSKSNTLTQTVTGSKGSTTPKTSVGSATLASGQSLAAGQSIATGNYKLVMQSDGNLVEYQGSKALWASGTAGHPGTGVVMQKDGNLVEYQGGHAIWASGTQGHAGSHLTLQASDGNVVIYQGSTALWATGT